MSVKELAGVKICVPGTVGITLEVGLQVDRAAKEANGIFELLGRHHLLRRRLLRTTTQEHERQNKGKGNPGKEGRSWIHGIKLSKNEGVKH